MEIKLFLNKDINENANYYFEKSKKLKFKLPKIESAIVETKKVIKQAETEKKNYVSKKNKEEKIKLYKTDNWYEKFRNTKTTNGFLFVIGNDSSTNEILIKKHLEKDDLVFHTTYPGSPFGILKNAIGKIDDDDLFDCGVFLAVFSSQWQKGFGTTDVFYVNSDQVVKKAISGEYIQKGSFMVYGHKNFLKNIPLRIGLGYINKKIKDEKEEINYYEIFSGSENVCKKMCDKFVIIEPGNDTYKKLYKKIKLKLKKDIDDLPHYIPNHSSVIR